jgi:hypothetical protein
MSTLSQLEKIRLLAKIALYMYQVSASRSRKCTTTTTTTTTTKKSNLVSDIGGNLPGTQARPTVIGNDVIVGTCFFFFLRPNIFFKTITIVTDAGSIIHAAQLNDGAWIQSGSIVLDGKKSLCAL